MPRNARSVDVDLRLLTSREKTLPVDALKPTYALSELFVELDLARAHIFITAPACEDRTNTLMRVWYRSSKTRLPCNSWERQL